MTRPCAGFFVCINNEVYPIVPNDSSEDIVWKTICAEDLWVLDKLILARTLGYCSGPTGMNVPKPGHYIVRPCVNLLGMGLGAQKIYLVDETDFLPLGHFWCEWFDGDHVSVDYENGNQILAVQGFRHSNNLTRWSKWMKIHKEYPIPSCLASFAKKYRHINIEYIGGKVIEVHFRCNPDWQLAENIQELIPVWDNQKISPPAGYEYIESPDDARAGFFVKYDK